MERSGASGGEDSSLPRLLATLYKRGFTGQVEVFDIKGKSTIYYRRGRVVKALRPDQTDALDQVLVQGRLAPAPEVADAVRLHGESEEAMAAALCRAGVLDAARLRVAVDLQLARQVGRCFFAEHPRLELSEAEHRFRGAEAPHGGELDPRIVIFPGIRAAYDDARLSSELASFVGARVHLLPVSPAFLREAGFREQDEVILKGLSGAPLEVTETWLQPTSDPAISAAKAALLALHCLDLLDVQRAVVPEAPAAPAGPRRRTGVTGLSALDPATVARMAEAFFKNGDLARAERAFALAIKSDPTSKRLAAFAAWIQFWKPGANQKALLAEAIKTMKDAIRADAAFGHGHYFLGALHKVGNDNDAAARSFKAAMDADATLVEAQRELRLLTMRKGRA
jgi:tetratricopeptide (TPR) repeat protein